MSVYHINVPQIALLSLPYNLQLNGQAQWTIIDILLCYQLQTTDNVVTDSVSCWSLAMFVYQPKYSTNRLVFSSLPVVWPSYNRAVNNNTSFYLLQTTNLLTFVSMTLFLSLYFCYVCFIGYRPVINVITDSVCCFFANSVYKINVQPITNCFVSFISSSWDPCI